MKWKKFTIHTTTAAVDYISQLLARVGIDGIEIEDNVPLTEAETKGMFIDLLPELPPDDGTARVTFYLDDTQETSDVMQTVRDGLEELRSDIDIGSGQIDVGETEDVDWINNWKQFFKPFVVDDILIKPTWEDVPEEHRDKLLIQIDPGTAFGTGMHETTQLCIRGIRKYMKPGDRMLDVGTGSGILAICALKLGASTAFGTDLDENTVCAVRENVQANNLDEARFPLMIGNLIDDRAVKDAAGYEAYDIAVANILADVILPLQREIVPHLKEGGIFITSGIIDTKEAAVKAAFAENNAFEVIETARQGEWVSVIARKTERKTNQAG